MMILNSTVWKMRGRDRTVRILSQVEGRPLWVVEMVDSGSEPFQTLLLDDTLRRRYVQVHSLSERQVRKNLRDLQNRDWR